MENATPNLRGLLEIFLAYKESELKADRTILEYRSTIERFLAVPGVPPSPPLNADHIVLFLAKLRSQGLAPASINHHQRLLYAWLRWLYKRTVLTHDITVEVGMVEIPKERKRSVTPDMMMRLLTVAMTPGKYESLRGKHRLRNVAIIRLLFATGLRRGELLGLDYKDVDWKRGELNVQAQHTKDREWRRVPFDGATKAALLEYIYGARGEGAGPLFLNEDGERLGRSGLRSMLNNYAKKAKVKLSTHDFRRGFAARARSSGMDIGHVQNLLGHNSPRMTIEYSGEGEKDAAILAYREKLG